MITSRTTPARPLVRPVSAAAPTVAASRPPQVPVGAKAQAAPEAISLGARRAAAAAGAVALGAVGAKLGGWAGTLITAGTQGFGGLHLMLGLIALGLVGGAIAGGIGAWRLAPKVLN